MLYRFLIQFSHWKLEFLNPKTASDKFEISVNFATFKDFVVSSWKRDGCIFRSSEEMSFVYETCFGKNLEPKLLSIHFRTNKKRQSHTKVSLRILARGPQSYSSDAGEVRISFQCIMSQQCDMTFQVTETIFHSHSSFDQENHGLNSQNLFWIGVLRVLDVWYVTSHESKWIQRLRSRNYQWETVSFLLTDTTNYLDSATLVFRIRSHDSATILDEFSPPLFDAYHPGQTSHRFQIQSVLKNHFEGMVHIQNGPQYWQMRHGFAI